MNTRLNSAARLTLQNLQRYLAVQEQHMTTPDMMIDIDAIIKTQDLALPASVSQDRVQRVLDARTSAILHCQAYTKKAKQPEGRKLKDGH
jgi:hypothetical protein